MKPENFEEKLLWYSIIGTYGLYFLGLQLIVIPLIAWFLVFYLGKKLWQQTAETPDAEKIDIPLGVWIWIASMILMELVTIMGHLDWELGTDQMIKSTIIWARSWALMAVFPLIGCLKIRPQLLYRAVSLLCLQSIVVVIFCLVLYTLHIPSFTYVVPLKSLFGGSPSDYSVNLFDVDIHNNNQLRLNLFTPFFNTLGIVGSLYFLLAAKESDKKLRFLAMIGAALMVIGSASRMTTFCLVIVPVLTWLLTHFTWPMQIATGVVSCLGGMFAPQIIDFVKNIYYETIKGYRSGSERVRSQLKEVAMQRWTESPIWGHGLVERGPKTVEFLPVGSHNQWPDLLFVKGIVGFFAFLIPLSWSFLELLIRAQRSATAKVALSVIVDLLICTYGADVEGSVYFYPAMIIMGIAFKEKVQTPAILNKECVPS